MILPFIIDIKKPTDFLTRGVAGVVINNITHNIYFRQTGFRTKKAPEMDAIPTRTKYKRIDA
jgi:hypothetical protein